MLETYYLNLLREGINMYLMKWGELTTLFIYTLVMVIILCSTLIWRKASANQYFVLVTTLMYKLYTQCFL